MSDFERYGDYNEVDESPKKSRVLLVIKITALVLCFSVVALLLFRVFSFNYYPDSMKKLYFTDTLTAYYNEKGGDIGAKTQELRAPYDDAELGNFFCDNLIIIEELGEIQISLRYNVSLADTIKEKYGADFDPDDTSRFTFTLTRSGGDESATGAAAGVPMESKLTACEWDSFMMYRYAKLVFDGVNFEGAEWIRLDIRIDGVEREEPFMVCIYENVSEYSEFTEYKLSSSEVPK